MSLTLERDDLPGCGPKKAWVAITVLMTGMYATVAVLAALTSRDCSGQGQHIDMALLDTQVAMLANMASNFHNSGARPSAGVTLGLVSTGASRRPSSRHRRGMRQNQN